MIWLVNINWLYFERFWPDADMGKLKTNQEAVAFELLTNFITWSNGCWLACSAMNVSCWCYAIREAHHVISIRCPTLVCPRRWQNGCSLGADCCPIIVSPNALLWLALWWLGEICARCCSHSYTGVMEPIRLLRHIRCILTEILFHTWAFDNCLVV